MNLIILILLISIRAFAPCESVAYILRDEPVNYYDPLIKAIVKVESNGNQYAFNALENAVGAFQVRECRLKDYNRLNGLKMRLSDMYDYEKAKQVFLYFTKGRSYEVIARAWCSGENGTKKASDSYYDKIKAAL